MLIICVLSVACQIALTHAAGDAGASVGQSPAIISSEQAESDEYTRYELLAPDSAQFRIVYDVTVTTPGAMFFFNPIRKGSEASNEAVFDSMTGTRLELEEVAGSEARTAGHSDADAATMYIRVHLARPVPPDGEARIRIEKTYRDPRSYFREGGSIVFSRSLSIRRNSVVLPIGYELVGCNVPSQVLTEPDGRIKVSFMTAGPDASSLVVRAKPLKTKPATQWERIER